MAKGNVRLNQSHWPAVIHFISPGEGAELMEKALRSIFTIYGLEWQSFDRLARIPRCILDDLVEEPLQLILNGADIESVWNFYRHREEEYMPIYASEIGHVAAHYWIIVSPVGKSAKKAKDFISKMEDENFLVNFRSTLLLPEEFNHRLAAEIGKEGSIALPDISLKDLCYTASDGKITCSLMPGKQGFAVGTKVEKFIADVLDAVA